MSRLPGTFRRRTAPADTLDVTLPARTLRLVTSWVEHLIVTGTRGDSGAAVDALRRAGLVPADMTDDDARVLLTIAIQYGRQQIAELGIGGN